MRYVGTTLPAVPVLCPVISISLHPLSNIWLGSDLQQKPTQSKPQSPGCRHLIPISSRPGCKPPCNGAADAKMSVMATYKSDVYHLLPMCHMYIGCQNKVLGIMSFILFLGVFAKLRKATINFMSVCPSVLPHEKTRLPLGVF
jgi:hypothetical protein